MLLEGIFIPITTPFHPDGRLFPRKLQVNVERYSKTPAAGMFVLSDIGEADSLTDEESASVLKTAIEAAAADKVMVACIARPSIFATLLLAQHAAALTYDAVAIHSPRFPSNGDFSAHILTYFRAIADQSPLPVILLDQSENPIAILALSELADHPNILAVVTSQIDPTALQNLQSDSAQFNRVANVTMVFAAATNRMMRQAAVATSSNLGGVAVLEVRPALKTRTKRVGFQILAASTSFMLQSWQSGASGAVPSLAACAPQACCEVWQAFRDGDQPLAEEKQDRLRAIAPLVEGPHGIATIKHGCDFNAYFGGALRLPLLPPTAASRAQIEAILTGMRN
jgi:dihydrodipicolinate synthase/N-acetylneuraminate lyase